MQVIEMSCNDFSMDIDFRSRKSDTGRTGENDQPAC